MIASLPMYDWPEVQSANDALWQGIYSQLSAKGIPAPQSLARGGGDEFGWLSPKLLLGQTCGYPFATELAGRVQYLATPVYDVEGCEGPRYSSALIVHRDSDFSVDELRGKKLAYTSEISWSGYRVIMTLFGRLEDHFGALVPSGGHRQSARMVAQGECDIAALDAVCWHLLQRFEPQTARKLKVIGWTGLHPALPFITSLKTPDDVVAELRLALKGNNNALALAGCEILDADDYAPMAQL